MQAEARKNEKNYCGKNPSLTNFCEMPLTHRSLHFPAATKKYTLTPENNKWTEKQLLSLSALANRLKTAVTSPARADSSNCLRLCEAKFSLSILSQKFLRF